MKSGIKSRLSQACLLLFFISVQVDADRFDAEKALTIYKELVASEPSGSYVRQGWLFFVSDQACFKEKQKYAGSKESKAATAQAMVMMSEYYLALESSLSRENMGGEGRLWDDLYLQYQKQLQARSQSLSIAGHRILDKDMGGCTRRVVYALPEVALNRVQSSAHAPVDLKKLEVGLFQTAFEQQDSARLAEYFHNLELYELAIAFTATQQQAQDWLYPSSISWYDDGLMMSDRLDQCQLEKNDSPLTLNRQLLAFLKASYCGREIDWAQSDLTYLANIKMDSGLFSNVLNTHDQQHLIKLVIEQRGFVLFKKPALLTEGTVSLNLKADALFKTGVEPENIISLYGLSLNANPLQPEVWARAGAVMLAYQYDEVAYAMFVQALLQSPGNSDYWIYLIKAMKALGYQNQADRLSKTINHLSVVFPPSHWGRAQLKKISS